MTWTEQEIYNTVRDHLLAQGEPAKKGETCKYRMGPLKCAVGVLIPDDMYRPVMEGRAVGWVARKYPELGFAPHVGLLATLQSIHDNDTPRDWPESLAAVARRCGLKP